MDLRKLREAVFQIAYALEHVDGEDIAMLISSQLKIAKSVSKQAHARAMEILAKKDKLDASIKSAASDYNIERIPIAELTILRLGAFELLFDDKIPANVVISEAIRLTRKFATREAAKFINATLDALHPEKSIA